MSTGHTWSETFTPPNFQGIHLVGFAVVEGEIYEEHLKYCILDKQYLYVQAPNIRVNLATDFQSC